MSSQDLAFASALEQAELVRSKEVSPVELVELYLGRIDGLNDTLGAYLTVAGDYALEAARRAEEIADDLDVLPPFFGVPISIKDLADTAGIVTTLGSKGFADRVPGADKAFVTRIKAAGFVILGKTNTPEFGTTPWTEPEGFPPARNPWDISRTPGGSSGGAAAAVAAGLCPIAHGSDGGGSVRIPSACCGLYGIKPSRGRVSNAPAPNSMLSEQGPIAWTVADAAALLDVMSGYEAGDAFWAPEPERPFLEEVGRDPGRLRVAYSAVPATAVDVHPANAKAAEDAAALLASLGHDVVEATPPYPENLGEDFLRLWCVGRAAWAPMPPIEEVGKLNRALIEIGMQTSAADYAASTANVQAAARDLVGFFDDVHVLVTPTIATPPPLVGQHFDPDNALHEFVAAAGFVPFTPPWNTTGQPAVSVPLYEHEGLPVGVQLVGRPADEATLIRVSAQLEDALPWRERRPPTA